jgi:hypothetical protein
LFDNFDENHFFKTSLKIVWSKCFDKYYLIILFEFFCKFFKRTFANRNYMIF